MANRLFDWNTDRAQGLRYHFSFENVKIGRQSLFESFPKENFSSLGMFKSQILLHVPFKADFLDDSPNSLDLLLTSQWYTLLTVYLLPALASKINLSFKPVLLKGILQITSANSLPNRFGITFLFQHSSSLLIRYLTRVTLYAAVEGLSINRGVKNGNHLSLHKLMDCPLSYFSNYALCSTPFPLIFWKSYILIYQL